MKKNMRVIITGGAGFIGSQAVKHFVNMNDDVMNVDKLTYASNISNLSCSNFIKDDICNTESILSLVKDFKPEIIINFAAETHVDNSIANCDEFVKSNIEGVKSLLNVCKETKTRFCHISTDEVYGPATTNPFVERDRLSPMNPYAATKAAADLMIQAYNNTYGINYAIIRPSNNYGPNQHSEKFIPKLIDCLKIGKKFPLYGIGDQEREWTYVCDTAKIVRSLLENKNTQWNQIYNLSSGITLKNIDVVTHIVELYNDMNKTNISIHDVIQFSNDRPGHDRKYWILAEKIKSFVDVKYTDFKEGLIQTLKHHESKLI